MINIYFKSNQVFSNDDEVIRISSYQVLKKPGRLVKQVVPSLSVLDDWTGASVGIQETIWDGWFGEIYINESQANMIPIIKACQDIIIEDTDNNIRETIDTSNSEFVLFEISDKVKQTSNYIVTINVRSNKKVINLKNSEFTPNLETDYGVRIDTTYYYTPVPSRLVRDDTEYDTIESGTGALTTVSRLNKEHYEAVFYVSGTRLKSMKEDFESAAVADMYAIHEGVEYQIVENSLGESDIIGEDLYKLIIKSKTLALITFD